MKFSGLQGNSARCSHFVLTGKIHDLAWQPRRQRPTLYLHVRAWPGAMLETPPPLLTTLQVYCLPEHRGKFAEAVRNVSVFSPNHEEAEALFGIQDFHQMVDACLDLGASVVALRCGADGSIVATPYSRWTIPAAPTKGVVDVTGCGNSYCGAMLASLVASALGRVPAVGLRTDPILRAAICGAVSASFTLEQLGTCDTPPEEEVKRRFEVVLAGVTTHQVLEL